MLSECICAGCDWDLRLLLGVGEGRCGLGWDGMMVGVGVGFWLGLGVYLRAQGWSDCEEICVRNGKVRDQGCKMLVCDGVLHVIPRDVCQEKCLGS